MSEYGMRDIERVLGLSPAVVRGLIRAGFVTPARGARNSFRFSFRDLIVLKAARELSLAHISPRRIHQALRRLRRELPADMPFSGLRIQADGKEVVVHQGARRWHAVSGQYLLDFDVEPAGDSVAVVAHRPNPRTASAERYFDEGCVLEESDPAAACEAYRQALAADPAHAAAAANLGRLKHLAGELEVAEHVYRTAIACGGPDALLLYNLGVLLEEQGRLGEAQRVYEEALQLAPEFADAHYNLALVCEELDERQQALRHLRHYRKLMHQGSAD